MKPVYQTKFGGSDAPENEQGNCMAACIASIFELGLDDVPDFGGEITNGKWWITLTNWLSRRGLGLLQLCHPPFDLPAGYAMMGVKSLSLPNADDGHMVVIQNGIVVHDPNSNNPKDANYEPTEYWVFVSLNPALNR